MRPPTPSTSEPAPTRRRLGRAAPQEGAPVTDLGRMLLGLVVVSLGVLFLLDTAGVLDAGTAIGRWWPLVIVAAGLLTLLERPPAVLRGTIITAVGGLLLLLSTDVLDESAWNYVWPALFILAGLAILLRWSGRRVAGGEGADEVIRTTAVFSGANPVSAAPQFRGAWLTAIFGGITLDLRGARPAEGASVNATAAFGGIDVLVPRGWRISVRSTPIFGGVDDKTDHAEPLPEDAPALHVDAVCLFGGVGIKHDK